ncbi:PIR protein CIR protein [Plasmodium vinckei lentum]|uniref:PIR protein CIR protein n=1 Tax=Plasmodium vinckei lentum TaxID=138297 RepID=A0A6V7RRZ4_PLAVN|nr:PIR protein CIR protein [Plasmodium vinckei lentum]
MDDKTCDVLSEVDNLFTRGIINESKFNNFKKCHYYCPLQNNSKAKKCSNDYERINALGSYLFNKISEIDKKFKGATSDKRHIEVFMMWLGDKLFKIENDYKATLEESYKNNLESITGNANYWETISKQLYKDATIKKMSEFYNLLNHICKLIIGYKTYAKNPQKSDRNRLGNYSAQCISYYRAIISSTNGCRPYLRLLDNLKMIYENFRMHKMDIYSKLNNKEKGLLLNRVKNITTFNDENKLFVTVIANLSFDDKECANAKSKDEEIGKSIISKKSQDTGKPKSPVRRTQTPVSGDSHHGNTGSTKPAAPHPPVLKPPERSPAQPQLKPKPEAKQQGLQTQQVVPPQKPEQPLAPPSASSKKDTKLKTPQTGEIHKNGSGGPSDGKGDSNNDPGVKRSGSSGGQDGGKVGSNGVAGDGKGGTSGEKGGASSGSVVTQGGQGGSSGGLGDGSGGTDVGKKYINPVLGSHEGSGTQLGTNGGQRSPNSGTGDPVNGEGGGKGDADSEGNGGGSGLGDQGKSPGGTGSVQGGQAKGPGDSSRGNPVPVQSAPVSSGTGTTPSPDTSQPPGTTSSPVSPPESQPDQKPQVQQPTSPVPAPPQNDPASQIPQTGGSNNSNESKDLGNGKGDTGGTNDGNGNPDGGSSDPASSTSRGSFDWSSSIFEFILKGKEYYNKASEFIEKNRQNFEDAKDKINGAYNSAMDNLKNAYNASSDYLNNFISNITSQLNQIEPPPKSGGNQIGPGSPTDGGNTLNPPPKGSPSTPSIDPPHKQSPITSPIDPSSNSLPTPPSSSQQNLPSTSTLNHPPSSNPIQQKQSSSQPQHITHQNTQVPAQVNQPNSQKIGQLVKSLSSDIILKKPWNIFPTTWNGSGDCKPEIKFMNATLVCCTSEQCSLTGIPVILVLIPIILLIAYKYLSFGLSKKSGKKNMKRVINFHDGNRKTKIIISSYDRNKDLKPVINSVGRKKNSLLNIYKLIRADPMPFINLFFLLIFFVYKRKRDTIE